MDAFSFQKNSQIGSKYVVGEDTEINGETNNRGCGRSKMKKRSGGQTDGERFGSQDKTSAKMAVNQMDGSSPSCRCQKTADGAFPDAGSIF